jgi:hypothetical protein
MASDWITIDIMSSCISVICLSVSALTDMNRTPFPSLPLSIQYHGQHHGLPRGQRYGNIPEAVTVVTGFSGPCRSKSLLNGSDGYPQFSAAFPAMDGSFFLDELAAGRTPLEQFRTAVFAQGPLCIVGCIGTLGTNGIEHGASPSRLYFLDGFYQVMSHESSFIFSALPFSATDDPLGSVWALLFPGAGGPSGRKFISPVCEQTSG